MIKKAKRMRLTDVLAARERACDIGDDCLLFDNIRSDSYGSTSASLVDEA